MRFLALQRAPVVHHHDASRVGSVGLLSLFVAAGLGAGAGSGLIASAFASTTIALIKLVLCLVAAGAALILAGGWALRQRHAGTEGLRIPYLWLVLIAPPVIVSLAFLPGHLQQFVLDGAVKRVVVPLMFLLVLPVAARPARLHDGNWRLLPMDWVVAALVPIALIGLISGLVYSNDVLTIGQDLGLYATFAIWYLAGRRTQSWNEPGSERRFLLLLLLLAGATSILNFTLTPLYSLPIAVALAAIADAVSSRKLVSLGLLGVTVLLISAYQVLSHPKGHLGSPHYQLVAGLLLLGFWLLRRTHLVPRWAFWVGAVAVVTLVLLTTTTGAVLTASYAGTDTDLRERPFEARQAQAAVNRSTATLMLGAGAGATLDLRAAPDPSVVLLRRDAAAVPEIHLLVEEVLWKQGLLGVFWLLSFIVVLMAVVSMAVEAAVQSGNPVFLFLCLLALLGTLDALPAATHLYDNPLTPLALGGLVSLVANERQPSPDLPGKRRDGSRCII